jgi:hypothetical protein
MIDPNNSGDWYYDGDMGDWTQRFTQNGYFNRRKQKWYGNSLQTDGHLFLIGLSTFTDNESSQTQEIVTSLSFPAMLEVAINNGRNSNTNGGPSRFVSIKERLKWCLRCNWRQFIPPCNQPAPCNGGCGDRTLPAPQSCPGFPGIDPSSLEQALSYCEQLVQSGEQGQCYQDIQDNQDCQESNETHNTNVAKCEAAQDACDAARAAAYQACLDGTEEIYHALFASCMAGGPGNPGDFDTDDGDYDPWTASDDEDLDTPVF